MDQCVLVRHRMEQTLVHLSLTRSHLLWTVGKNSKFGKEASHATAHIQDLATSSKLPYVSFKCTTNTEIPHVANGGQARCTLLLVAMLLSLINQLVCYVPQIFEEPYDLENAILALKGEASSIPEALKIIQVLLQHRTPLLLVILDGLELVEDADTMLHLRKLIELFHTRDEDSRLKVLLGSQGYLASSVDIGVDERVDCTTLPRRRPGRHQPDGRLLGEKWIYDLSTK